MVTLEWQDVEIDYCVRCRGVWLDAGELQDIVGATDDGAAARADELELALAAARKAHGRRRCPRCYRRLQTFTVTLGEGSDLVMDRCRQGHGYWFDGGELQRYLTARDFGTAAGERVWNFLREVFEIQHSSG